MQAAQHKKLYQWHRISGLWFIIFLLVLVFTALPLLFIDALELWLLNGLPISELSANTWLQLAGERFELQNSTSYLQFFPSGNPSILWVKLGEEFEPWTLLNNGEFFALTFFDALHVLEHAHYNFLLPGAIGEYVVGLVGLAALLSVLIGVLIHNKWRQEALQLRVKRSKRLLYSDLHKLLGLWLLPFHFLLTYTGAVLGLGGLLIIVAAMAVFEGDQEKAIAAVIGEQTVLSEQHCSSVDIDLLIKQSGEHWRSLYQQAELANIEINGWQDCNGRLGVSYKLPGYWLVDSNTSSYQLNNGNLVRHKDWVQSGLGSRWYSLLAPLHFGDFAGDYSRWVYFASAVLMALMLLSGLSLYIDKLPKKKQNSKRFWWSLASGISLAVVLNTVLLLGLARLHADLNEGQYMMLYLLLVFIVPALVYFSSRFVLQALLLFAFVAAQLLGLFDVFSNGIFSPAYYSGFFVASLLPLACFVYLRSMQKSF